MLNLIEVKIYTNIYSKSLLYTKFCFTSNIQDIGIGSTLSYRVLRDHNSYRIRAQ